MNKDNLLGAPTEGLGQTVTFAGAPGQTPRLQLAGRTGVVQSIGNPALAQVGGLPQVPRPEARDRTFELLAGVADDYTTRRIKEEQQSRFLSGMQQVAAGATVEQIAKDRPAYTEVFGEADVVAGARAYAQSTAASKVALRLQEGMDQYAELPADQFGKVVNDIVTEAMQGDPATDAYTMQALGRTLPQVFATHARAHVRHTQMAARREQTNSRLSGAALLQDTLQRAIDDEAPEESRAAARESFVGSLLQPAGQPDASYSAGLAEDLSLLAEQGSFHAINTAREAGVFDLLDAKARAVVERTIETNERQMASKPVAEKFFDRVLELSLSARRDGTDQTRESLLAAYDKINEEWRARTGVRTDLIPRQQRASEVAALASTQEQDARRRAAEGRADARAAEAAASDAAREAAKAQEVADEEDAATRAFLAGRPDMIEGSVSGALADKVLRKHLDGILSSPGPLSHSNLNALRRLDLWRESGKSIAWVEGRARTQLKNAVNTRDLGQFATAYENFLRMQQFPGLAAAVYGEDNYARLLAFNAMHPQSLAENPGPNVESAFVSAMASPEKPRRAKVDKADIKALTSAITDKHTRWFGGPSLSDDGVRKLVDRLTPAVELFMGQGQDADSAAASAMAIARSQGAAVFGSHVIFDRHLAGKSRIDALRAGDKSRLIYDDASTDRHFNDFVKEFVGDAELAGMMPGASPGQLLVLARREGEVAVLPTSYGDIGAWISKRNAASVKQKPQPQARSPFSYERAFNNDPLLK